jgi:hypothetical protein
VQHQRGHDLCLYDPPDAAALDPEVTIFQTASYTYSLRVLAALTCQRTGTLRAEAHCVSEVWQRIP